MPQYKVRGPDGKVHTVDAPEGATEQQAIQYIAETKYGVAGDDAPVAPANPQGEYNSGATSGRPLAGNLASAIPFVGPAAAEGVDPGRGKRTLFDFLRLTGTDADKQLAIGAMEPGAQFLEAEIPADQRERGGPSVAQLRMQALTGATPDIAEPARTGAVVRRPGQPDQWVNEPGASLNDLSELTAQTAPFLIPFGGAPTSAAMRYGAAPTIRQAVGAAARQAPRMAAQAVPGAVIRESLNAGARSGAGGTTDLGDAAGRVAFDAALGGAAHPVMTFLGGLGKGAGKWVGKWFGAGGPPSVTAAQVKQAAREAGHKISDDVAAATAAKLKETSTDDVMQALRMTEAERAGVRLNEGQLTGDNSALDRIATLGQTSEGNAASNVALAQSTNEDSIAGRLRSLFGMGGSDKAARGGAVQGSLLAKAEASHTVMDDAYKAVPGDASFNPLALRVREKKGGTTGYGMLEESLKPFERKSVSSVHNVLGEIREIMRRTDRNGNPVPINYKVDWEGQRTKLTNLAFGAGTLTERKAARAARDAFDELSSKLEAAGVVKSPSGDSALDALKAARSERIRHTAEFEGGDLVETLTKQKYRSGKLQPVVDQSAVVEKTMGKGRSNIVFSPAFEKDMAALKARTGDGTPEWQAIQDEAAQRLGNKLDGAKTPEAAREVELYLDENATRLGHVLPEEKLDELRSLARVKQNALRTGKAGAQPNIVGQQRALTAAGLIGSGAIGSLLGGPVGGVGGAATFGAILAGSNAIARRRAASKASKAAEKALNPALTGKLKKFRNPNTTGAVGLFDYLKSLQEGEQ